MCGLKQILECVLTIEYNVTPFVGVWIETAAASQIAQMSYQVTPFVGVWIETSMININEQINQVTPFVGVWIETTNVCGICRMSMSHPSWVCGLKLR